MPQNQDLKNAFSASILLLCIGLSLSTLHNTTIKTAKQMHCIPYFKSAKIMWYASFLHTKLVKVVTSRDHYSKLSLTALAGPYAHMVTVNALKTHLAPRLIAAVIHVENRGFLYHCAARVSGSGAIGPMQLMPNTAWNVERVNPWRPAQNIKGGALYLKSLIQQFHGDLFKALVAYNAGPTVVMDGKAPASAIAYADTVLGLYKA